MTKKRTVREQEMKIRRAFLKEIKDAAVPIIYKYRKRGLSWETLGWLTSCTGQLEISMGFSSELPRYRAGRRKRT